MFPMAIQNISPLFPYYLVFMVVAIMLKAICSILALKNMLILLFLSILRELIMTTRKQQDGILKMAASMT